MRGGTVGRGWRCCIRTTISGGITWPGCGMRSVKAMTQVVVATANLRDDGSDGAESNGVSLQASAGADALLTVATPKFAAAQAIRAVAALKWRPAPHYLSNVSASAASVMVPAGAENWLSGSSAGRT